MEERIVRKVSAVLAAGAIALALGLMLLGDAQAALVERLLARGGGPLATLLLLSPGIAFLLACRGILRTTQHDREMKMRVRAQREAHALAKCDPLTGLLNRRGLIEGIAVLAAGLRPKHQALVLMVLDLDHFKLVNDVHGHLAGDALIREVSGRLAECCPPHALVARMGGDEFAIAFNVPPAIEQALSETVAGRIVAALSETLAIDELRLHIGASLGLTSTTDAACGVDTLLRRADVAMYRAKQAGRNCYCWFDRTMQEDIRRRSELESELRSGIPRGEIIPYYEPQVMLETGEIVGFEVLVRWHHPKRGVIQPTDFITIAEDSGLIGELSLRAMRLAMIDALAWGSDYRLAVNISPIQLRDPLLAQKILKLLIDTGFPPHRLEIEITETALVSDMATARTVVTSLKNQGVRLALDDFGTGYSSLHHLRALPFDKIKIDRSFVSSALENGESAAIVRAVLSLGNSLKVDVTAEGIENSAIETMLRALACPQGQGWLYSKPVPQAEVLGLLRKGGTGGQVSPAVAAAHA